VQKPFEEVVGGWHRFVIVRPCRQGRGADESSVWIEASESRGTADSSAGTGVEERCGDAVDIPERTNQETTWHARLARFLGRLFGKPRRGPWPALCGIA
jgi:hypothetical protein